MIIKSIEIRNFKGIEHLTYTPENKTAVLVAENGKGKTSFLEAVRFALTGDAPDNCIREGSDDCTVSVLLDDGTTFERTKSLTKPTKVRLNGRTTPAKNLDAYLEDITGVNKDALKITTSSEILEAMSPGEFGSFLMSYIPEKLDFDILCSYIPGLTPEAKEILSDLFPVAPRKFEISQISEAYTSAFEQRKLIRKEADARKTRIAAFRGNVPARDINEINDELDRIAKAQGAQAAAADAIHLYEAAVRNRKAAEANIKALEDAINKNGAKKPLLSDAERMEKEQKRLSADITAVEAILAVIEQNLTGFEHTLETLAQPECPISKKLVCTTDKTKVRAEIQELIEANKKGKEIQLSIIQNAKDALEKSIQEKKLWDEANERYREKVQLVARLEDAKKNLPAIPSAPASLSAPSDYSAQKALLTKERDNYIAYQEFLKLNSEAEILQKKYEALDFVCKALDEKGEVMNKIITSYTHIFEDVINARADEMGTGYAIRFVPENGVNPMIKTPKATEYRLYSALSHGERLITVFLLLDMLNTLCGTRLMLLDDVNHLDSDNARILLNLLNSKSVQDAYDHIFICSAINSDIKTITDSIAADYIF